MNPWTNLETVTDKRTGLLPAAVLRAETPFLLAEIVSYVSHNVRNPLAGMMMLASKLRRDLSPEGGHVDRLDRILDSIKAMNADLDKLSHCYPRSESSTQVFDANEATRVALAFYTEQMSARNLAVVVDVDPALPRACGDAALVVCILTRLLDNAMESMSSGGTLTLKTHAPAAGQIRIEVHDNGPGIASEVMETIFQPFHTTKPGHLGLGLSVAQRMARYLSGALNIEAGATGGVIAVLSLNAAPPHADQESNE